MNKKTLFLLASVGAVCLYTGPLNASTTVGSVSNTVNSAATTANSIGSGVNGVSSLLDQYLGTSTSGVVSQGTNAVSGTMGQVSGLVSSGTNTYNQVTGIYNQATNIGSIGQAGNVLTSTGSQVDSLLETNVSGVTGQVGGIISSGTNAYNQIGNMANQLTGAYEMITNPSNLLQMGMGAFNFSNISGMAMNAATDVLTDFMATPMSGIPINEPSMKAGHAAEQAAKEASAEVQDRIAEEQQKQVDVLGSRPQQPNPESADTNTANADGGSENPAEDNCPAFMSQFKDATHNAFNFVEENLLKKRTQTVAPAQEDLTGALSFVENTFFAKSGGEDTAEKERIAKARRSEYLQEVQTQLMALSLGVSQNLIEDAKSISKAPTSGCNVIDDLNLNTVTMITLAKQTMADIALQLQMFELDAIRRQNNVPVRILEKPTEENAQ
ncbi:MAG: hypothetical protein IKY98_00305 [Alphaproteobacteria bacterium]|nr:hypothetical protein [Alphaproteobacteria bacterium]